MMNTVVGSLGGGSFAHGSSKRSFDVRKEGDVIELLRVVHQNALDSEIKNHLRDLIFTYRQTMSPEDAKLIQQSFAPLSITIVFSDQAEVQPTSSVSPAKGFSRPMPRFVPVAVHPKSQEPSVPVTHSSTPEAEVTVEPAAPTATITSHTPPTEPEATVVPARTAAVLGTSSTSASERIKEIKRLVNEKIGNPVNLMDTHTEIGREYMNALLDAMKKSNGAQAGELEASMIRLETAFKKVQGIIVEDGHPQVSVSKEEKLPETPNVETPVQKPVSPTHIDSVSSHPNESEPQAAPLSASGEVSAVPIRLVSVKQNIAEKSPASAEVASTVTQSTPLATPESAIHSVAKEKQLQELLRVNKQREAQSKIKAEEVKNANTDPLYSPEVTAGLNQLLSEWGLFKSSGLFGTGPNGKDHPLFKKLESLTMAAVIAGRFEGATPAIKQSITDYMNGWRYEEGIVHEHAETFEHYLRKVVAQILNRKKLG